MKSGIMVCLVLSIIVPIVFWGVTAQDMRNWSSYKSYCDSNGEVQHTKTPSNMYDPDGGVFSQYWQFHGVKNGIINWAKYSSLNFIALFLAVFVTLRLNRID
ncbi:MAG: hypothetical protein KUG61_11115 [Parvibaculaceae bacterium]|nr:hypothetical protein [Parvibaculaceae bacterium]